MEETKVRSEVRIEENVSGTEPEWKPNVPFYLAFISLCIIILAAALDATSLSVALPVRKSRIRVRKWLPDILISAI